MSKSFKACPCAGGPSFDDLDSSMMGGSSLDDLGLDVFNDVPVLHLSTQGGERAEFILSESAYSNIRLR